MKQHIKTRVFLYYYSGTRSWAPCSGPYLCSLNRTKVNIFDGPNGLLYAQ